MYAFNATATSRKLLYENCHTQAQGFSYENTTKLLG